MDHSKVAADQSLELVDTANQLDTLHSFQKVHKLEAEVLSTGQVGTANRLNFLELVRKLEAEVLSMGPVGTTYQLGLLEKVQVVAEDQSLGQVDTAKQLVTLSLLEKVQVVVEDQSLAPVCRSLVDVLSLEKSVID